MQIDKIKTRKILPPKDDINDLIGFIPKLSEKSIVVVSSKVISICEGQTIDTEIISHEQLIKKLAEKTLEPVRRGANDMILTQMVAYS